MSLRHLSLSYKTFSVQQIKNIKSKSHLLTYQLQQLNSPARVAAAWLVKQSSIIHSKFIQNINKEQTVNLRTKQTCFKLKAGIQHPGGVSATPSLNLSHGTSSSRTWSRFWEPFHFKKVSLQTPRERVVASPEAPSSQLTPS